MPAVCTCTEHTLIGLLLSALELAVRLSEWYRELIITSVAVNEPNAPCSTFPVVVPLKLGEPAAYYIINFFFYYFLIIKKEEEEEKMLTPCESA